VSCIDLAVASVIGRSVKSSLYVSRLVGESGLALIKYYPVSANCKWFSPYSAHRSVTTRLMEYCHNRLQVNPLKRLQPAYTNVYLTANSTLFLPSRFRPLLDSRQVDLLIPFYFKDLVYF
jgi:hypothetical protein